MMTSSRELLLNRVMENTALFTSALCEQHDVPDHPERPQRTRVVRDRIVLEFPSIRVVQEIRPVTLDQLRMFHTDSHVNALLRVFDQVESSEKEHRFDEDTIVRPGTQIAAFTAAGAVCDAIDLVMKDTSAAASVDKHAIRNAFCAVRPPGHHAEPQRAMGFCFFNNVGIGACHLLQKHSDKIKKVLILDFDVHHGNGLQAKFASMEDFPGVYYISTHQSPFYPSTGKSSERGKLQNILNVPLGARTTTKSYRKAFEERVLPAMHAYEPDFILLSAGFDAHAQDPLADMSLQSSDYYWITKQVVDVAWKHAQGRIVSVLEGGTAYSLKALCCPLADQHLFSVGYDLDALAESTSAHMRALVEGAIAPQPDAADDSTTLTAVDLMTAAFESSLSVGGTSAAHSKAGIP